MAVHSGPEYPRASLSGDAAAKWAGREGSSPSRLCLNQIDRTGVNRDALLGLEE